MITPDQPMTDPAAAGCEIYVPLASLAIEGTAPAEGDEIEFTGRGRISRVDGENACIAVSTVNDAPVSAPAAEPDADEDMMAAAMAADAGAGES